MTSNLTEDSGAERMEQSLMEMWTGFLTRDTDQVSVTGVNQLMVQAGVAYTAVILAGGSDGVAHSIAREVSNPRDAADLPLRALEVFLGGSR